ncbi:MAG: hypothetical protein ACM3ZA_12740 [Bacillota bacterium]
MFTQLSLVSTDVGFSHVKTHANGQDILFPSVVAIGRERILAHTFFEDHGEITVDQLVDKLHINYRGRDYFVGKLGAKNGGEYNWAVNRLDTLETKISALTSIALTMVASKQNNQNFMVVTGLPIEHFRDSHLRREYEKSLTGKHEITFILPNGKTLTKSFLIVKLRVLPQGLGCFYDVTFGEEGHVARPELLRNKHLLIDIGFRTVDVTVVNDFEPVDLSSYSLDGKGIKRALENILEDIKGTKDAAGRLAYPEFNKTLSEMEEIFLAGAFFYDGQDVDLSPYVERWMPELVSEIENSVDTRLGGFSSFHHVFLSGGGGIATHKFFRNPRVELTPGSWFANCHGFYKVAFRQLREKLAKID